jgi:endonuclease YncB( thermonuclease family)
LSAAALLCVVIAVADGDTLTARCQVDGKTERIPVRLAQVDAPETTSAQPYARTARNLLRALCLKRQAEVRLTGKVTYNRKVAEVACQGEDVTPKLLRADAVWAYVGFAKDPAVFKLEAAARAARVRLWAASALIPPWKWREGVR